jgi:hypothetical protein
MKRLLCFKCKKEFLSKYQLDRHTNKKIPCVQDVKNECKKCNKVFSSEAYLKRHLTKKIPCIKITHKNIEESEKIKILKMKQDHELKKIKENAKREEKKISTEEKKILLKKEILKVEKKKIKLSLEVEVKKTERAIAVEEAKTSRKMKTAQVINNIHIDQLNTQINNYNVNLPTDNVFPATEEYLDYPRNRFRILTSKHDAVEMVYPNKFNSNLPIKIISKLHGGEALPEYRNLWYNSELDSFHRIVDKKWVPILEKGWLEQQVRSSLDGALNVLKENTKHYTASELDEPNYYTNFGLFNGYLKQKTDDYYRDIGTKGLAYESEKNKQLDYFGDITDGDEDEVYPEDPSFNNLLEAIKRY